jgi:hypothetical protein
MEIQLGSIDYCDEASEYYDEMECESQLMWEDERKQNRRDFWNGLLKTGLTILGGGSQTPTKNDVPPTNPPQKTSTKDSTSLAYQAEKAMFERLTAQEKREYAKENPRSKVVQEYLQARMWKRIGIGVGVLVGTGIAGYTIYKVFQK